MSPKKSMGLEPLVIAELLKTHGFYQESRMLDGKDEVSYGHKKNGIYYEATPRRIRKLLIDELMEREDIEAVNAIASTPDTTVANVLILLPEYTEEKPLPVLSDTKDEIRIPFQNGVVCITRDSIQLKEFEQVLDGNIGVRSSSVIKRNIDIDNMPRLGDEAYFDPICLHISGLYAEFVKRAMIRDGDNTSSNYKKSLRAIESVIGYLLHQYKDKTNAKLVFLTDWHPNDIQGRPEGGNGKQLIMADALKEIRGDGHIVGGAITVLNAQSWQSNNDASRFNLPSSRISEIHDVVILEDAPNGWDIQPLFNHITGDFETESKGKDRHSIPFEKAPKILVTSNYHSKGSGNSYDRRRFILHIGNYWKSLAQQGKEPKDELGKGLFGFGDPSFVEKDWQEFYYYIFLCCQRFLSGGLRNMDTTAHDVGSQLAPVAQTHGLDTAVWLRDHLLNRRIGRYDEKPGISESQLFDEFVEDLPHYAYNETSNPTGIDRVELHSLLRDVVEEMGLEYNPFKSGTLFRDKRWMKAPGVGGKPQQPYIVVA